MEIFGYSIQTIYLFALVIGGVLTFLYILFGDLLEGLFEILPDGFISPTLVLSFITFTSATGYIFEKLTSIHSGIILIISVIVSLLLVTLLNVFVLIPLSSAEESLAYRDEDLKGRIGRVIVSIPEDGFGEVIIEGNGGNIGMSAKSFEEKAIPYDTKVLVIDVQDSVLYVLPQQDLDFT
ncbi:NfeD family protein [Bacillus sp. PS06]|uniref:NfeD family protein n=1 Tax=Bacillus sp. PS06 TaxID=2764176 RepID=UPI001786AA48|nr:NfeD family protein [Bacillus sp. PS06]MBD8067767.1 NfeD family protein [Bacillus sp. PS06]